MNAARFVRGNHVRAHLAAMVIAGYPVAIGVSLVAHGLFHLPLGGWLGAAICFCASAAATHAAARFTA